MAARVGRHGNRVRLLTGAEFDGRRRGGDLDRFREGADRERQLPEIEHLARIEHEASLLGGLESREFRADRVASPEQRREGEIPVRARGRLAGDDAFLLIERRHLNAWNRASLIVYEPALDLGALRPCGGGDQPGCGKGLCEKSTTAHRCLPGRGGCSSHRIRATTISSESGA